jgi:hypothetical protein
MPLVVLVVASLGLVIVLLGLAVGAAFCPWPHEHVLREGHGVTHALTDVPSNFKKRHQGYHAFITYMLA